MGVGRKKAAIEEGNLRPGGGTEILLALLNRGIEYLKKQRFQDGMIKILVFIHRRRRQYRFGQQRRTGLGLFLFEKPAKDQPTDQADGKFLGGDVLPILRVPPVSWVKRTAIRV